MIITVNLRSLLTSDTARGIRLPDPRRSELVLLARLDSNQQVSFDQRINSPPRYQITVYKRRCHTRVTVLEVAM